MFSICHKAGRSLVFSGALCLSVLTALPGHAAAPTAAQVLKTYGDIAQAGYEDSLETAKTLRAAVAALVALPSTQTLAAARAAWVAVRVPYQQTEAYRLRLRHVATRRPRPGVGPCERRRASPLPDARRLRPRARPACRMFQADQRYGRGRRRGCHWQRSPHPPGRRHGPTMGQSPDLVFAGLDLPRGRHPSTVMLAGVHLMRRRARFPASSSPS